jgi:hypothetical protein
MTKIPDGYEQDITLKIQADTTVPKGGLTYRTVLGALLSDTAPVPVAVDITGATSLIGNRYSSARIRFVDNPKRYLAAQIRYSVNLGELMPSTGSFMIDPRTIPDEHFEVHWGNMASPNNTDWVLKVTMPMSAVVDL